MKKTESILLYRDDVKLKQVRNEEGQKRRVIQEIKEIVKVSINDVLINYNELIEKGSSVLVDAYISEYAPTFPKHLEKTNKFLADTNTDLKQLEMLISEIKKSNLSQTIITPEGELISTIKDEDFNVYLDESQRDFYNTVVAFKDILNKLQSEKYPYQNYHSVAIQLTHYLYFDAEYPNQAVLKPEAFK